MVCNGYEMVYMPEHHLAYANGHVYIHMIEAEKMLGRKLKDGETVHHKDGDRLNNSWNNLMVFKDDRSHQLYHHGAKAVKTGDCWACESEGRGTCPICGSEKGIYAKFCKKCNAKIKGYRTPKKELLEHLILNDNLSMVKIGKLFGVSDNSVRKWCKKYNLPYYLKDRVERKDV